MSQVIKVSVENQRLELVEGNKMVWSALISTSRYGVGEQIGSFKTPQGWHSIAQKIGEGMEIGTIFKARLPQGVWQGESTKRDLILTRVLWLKGEEEHNRTSYERYIYIHGTNHEELIGQPASYGCVRMKNMDVATLYNLVEVGTKVYIR